MARKDSENQKRSMSRLFRGKAIFKPLNTGRIDERVACVREWVANIFFYTKNAGQRSAVQRCDGLYRRDRKPVSDRRSEKEGDPWDIITGNGMA